MLKLLFLVVLSLGSLNEAFGSPHEDYMFDLEAGESAMDISEIISDDLIMRGIRLAVDKENERSNNMNRCVLFLSNKC